METTSVFPYYHPTTVVFVDDNIDFLSNLSLQLEADLAYRLFESPRKALRHLNNAASAEPLSKRFFASHGEWEGAALNNPLIRLDMAAIEREMNNTSRFSETSVVLVDYAMPGMDGLTFCRQIENPYVKKILFTGVADETVAVKAFNDGLIDRFVLKNERDVYEQINQAIGELQRSYIRDCCLPITHVLSLRSPGYLSDEAFVRLFQQLRREHGFVEYYLSVEPSGFLLLDADAAMSRLVVLTEDELRTHYQIAQDQGAPPELLAALERGDTVPYFGHMPDSYYRPEFTHWRECLYPAGEVHGRQSYFWALVPESGADAEARSRRASYNAYLDWLDTTGYALI